MSANYGWTEFVRGDLARARALCALALSNDLEPIQAHICLARVMTAAGRQQDAAQHAIAAMTIDHASAEKIAEVALAEEPLAAFARWRAGRLQQDSHARLALMHAWAGENERVLDFLERAHRQHDAALPLLLLDPAFDAVAGDSRFVALLNRLGIQRV
jgi:hypothetical protein